MKILGLSSVGLLGYEAPRSGAFRKFSALGGTLFGRRDIPVSPQGDTPPQMCFEGGGRNSISARTCTPCRFCCLRRRFGEFRRPFAPYEDPSRRPPKTDEVHLPIACKRTAPAAPAARARASTVWHLQPAQHIAMTACALLGRITLVGPVHHGFFGAIAV